MVKYFMDKFTKEKDFRAPVPDEKQRIYIECDGERSFNALAFDKGGSTEGRSSLSRKDSFEVNGVRIIIISKPDDYHNRLSLINRVIRTIRDFAYQMFGTEKNIAPEQLSEVLKYYNERPHKTLSMLIGFNVSPKMLLDDVELEGFIAKKLMYLNTEQEKKKLAIGDRVTVAHQSEIFEKRRYSVEPGLYTVIGVPGTTPDGETPAVAYKNNMYKVRNDLMPGLELEVPGFYLKKFG
jgi:hypothetical protein